MDASILKLNNQQVSSTHFDEPTKYNPLVLPSHFNYGYNRYVGYSDPYDFSNQLFSQRTINVISRQVTYLTRGLHPSGRPMVVPDERIADVLNNIYQGYTPSTGDIFSRYIIPTGSNSTGGMFQSLIDQTIEVIVSNLYNEFDTIAKNNKLTAWATVLGDFSENGIRAYAPIKTRNRRPQPMQFNMNY